MLFFRTRKERQELEAMGQYDMAIDSIALGNRAYARLILDTNLSHWKEIGFLLPSADLAITLGDRNLAARLYEQHGDTEDKKIRGSMSKTSSYRSAIRLYSNGGFVEASQRVREKLKRVYRPGTAVVPSSNPFMRLFRHG